MIRYQISWKSVQFGAEFHSIGRTDGLADKHDEANSRFSQIRERT